MGSGDFTQPNTASIFENQGKDNKNQLNFFTPRFGFGAFIHGWLETFKFHYGYEPEIIEYGN